jgi:hypothetical protein
MGDSCPPSCCASSGDNAVCRANPKKYAGQRPNAPHLIEKDRIRDLIYRLQDWADTSDEQAAKWERDRDWGISEREHQRSLHAGISIGLTQAANAIANELAEHAEAARIASLHNSLVRIPPGCDIQRKLSGASALTL